MPARDRTEDSFADDLQNERDIALPGAWPATRTPQPGEIACCSNSRSRPAAPEGQLIRPGGDRACLRAEPAPMNATLPVCGCGRHSSAASAPDLDWGLRAGWSRFGGGRGRAIEAENTFAALICTSFFGQFALLTGDPQLGQVWVTRGWGLHERIGVGYVSYSLAGGIGPISGTLGYAADRIRSLDVVTSDGVERSITADLHLDLFWALRGGGGNFAAVTRLEADLVPLADGYAGAIFFAGERAAEVLEAFQQCADSASSELSLSTAILSYPDAPALPPAICGTFCFQARVAYVGATEAARGHLAPLDQLKPLLNTCRRLPMSEIRTIHADPSAPTRVNSNSLALSKAFAPAQVSPFAASDAPYVLELRHLRGALAGREAPTNAVGHRAARFNLSTSTYPNVDPGASARAQQHVCNALGPVGDGGPLRNFLPTGAPDATSCYSPEIASKLAGLKAAWDPADLFRYAPKIRPPER